MIPPVPTTEKQFCFLSGLPRSGSTLLSALLNEHPDIHASTNSPLLELIHYTENYLLVKSEQYKAHPKPASAHRVLSSLARNYYFDTPERFIVDKSRGWANQVKHITDYITDTPRIICTVRNIADIVISFLALIERSSADNYIDNVIRKNGLLPTAETRFNFLMATRGTVGHAYLVLREAFLNDWARYLLLVEYKDLVADTQTQMNRIYEFIGVEPHVHNTDKVRAKYSEADSVYGLRDMHTLRPSISQIQRDRSAYLTREQLDRCRDLEFWRSAQ